MPIPTVVWPLSATVVDLNKGSGTELIGQECDRLVQPTLLGTGNNGLKVVGVPRSLACSASSAFARPLRPYRLNRQTPDKILKVTR